MKYLCSPFAPNKNEQAEISFAPIRLLVAIVKGMGGKLAFDQP